VVAEEEAVELRFEAAEALVLSVPLLALSRFSASPLGVEAAELVEQRPLFPA